MSNLPVRRHEAALTRIDRQTGRDIEVIRGRGLVAAAEVQAIEYVTTEAERSAVGIALTETLCTQLAPHAAERFRVIAEAGTQALVMKVMRAGQ
ncbi:MAG TPA: hypothetical protein VNQ77_15100 [Frankiaceae bacterium]|nr:hypothetical protein [Frankiaceae bacterium]